MKPIPSLFAVTFAFASFAAVPVAADTPLTVEIVTATATPLERGLSLTGEIVARNSLTVSFPSGGRIESVAVREGDHVAAGEELARITAIQQEQALRAARAAVSTATADRDQAVEDLRRQDALLERGATTRVARDNAADQTRVKDGILAQAIADLELAEKALEDTVVAAPAAATVTRRFAEPGQVVGAVQPVVELALGSMVDAVFDVPESLLTGSTTVDQVQLTPLGRPDQILIGAVREVSPLVDPTKGTVTIKVSIDAKPEGVEYGDAVRGTTIESVGEAIVLPYNAMSATAQGPAVWVVDPDTMAVGLMPITIERYETGRIIVKDGIAEGALVVAAGAQLLYPGRIVRAIEGTNP